MPRTSRTFRLFISSTFRDFVHERTVLQRHVFPKLKELCERHGAKFQPIDLRWGITEEASIDHKTIEICLNELQRSIELSPKPNFLILLGERYGWVPLPTYIEKQEFEKILEYYNNEDQDAYSKLLKWYKEDKNHLPPYYVLQPREGKYLNYLYWEKEETDLRTILQDAVEALAFPEALQEKYKLSATEHEIQSGAFKQQDADQHVFAFMRNIKSDVIDSNYHDLDSSGEKSLTSEKQVNHLKEKIYSYLSEENIHSYNVGWQEDDIDFSYLTQFYHDVLERLTAVIKKELQSLTKTNDLENEVKKHQQQGEKLVQSFKGRQIWIEETLESIKNQQTTVISGESGMGKSSVTAVLANQLKSSESERKIIQRHIGTTIYTQNTLSLLQTIWMELDREGKWDERIKDIDEILAGINNAIQSYNVDYVVIFLDGTERLEDPYKLLKWIQQLSTRIKLVVTVSEEFRAYKLLTNVLSHETFIKLGGLSRNDGIDILNAHLTEANRTLQPKQLQHVMRVFEENPSPLFISIAMEEIKRWKSYDNNVALSESLDQLLNSHFHKIVSSASQSSLFVEHALGLLSTAREGLSENELMEIISQDEDVVQKFYESSKHDYVGEMLPIVLWARLYNEIEPFLIEKDQNGMRLYQFDHKQMQDFVHSRYANKSFHQLLADYFYNRKNYLDTQGLTPNIRKAAELPYQLLKQEALPQLEKLLMDFDFSKVKFDAGLGPDFLEDLLKCINMMKKTSIELDNIVDYLDFYKSYHSKLVQFPEMIRAFALQIGGNSNVSKEAKRWFRDHEIPHLLIQDDATDKAEYFHTFSTNERYASTCTLHPSEPYAVIGARDKVQIWDIRIGEYVEEFYLDSEEIIDVQFHKELPYVGILTKGTLYVYRISQGFGTIYYRLFNSEDSKQFTAMQWHPTNLLFVAGNDIGTSIICDIENSSEEKVIEEFQLHSSPIQAFAFNTIEGQIVLWYGNGDIVSHDYKRGKEISRFPIGMKYEESQSIKWSFSMDWLESESHQYILTSVSTLEEKPLTKFVPPNNVSLWNTHKGFRENGTVSLTRGLHKLKNGYVYTVLTKGTIQKWNPQTGLICKEIELGYTIQPLDLDVSGEQIIVLDNRGRALVGKMYSSKNSDLSSRKILMTNDHFLWTWTPIFKYIKKNSKKPKLLGPKIKLLLKTKGNHVVSSSISPYRQYFSKGYLDGTLKIVNEAKGEIIEIKPFKTNPIVFQDWSLNELYILFGTKDRAWVLNVNTKLIAYTFKFSNYAVLNSKWSPKENKVAILYSNGEINIFDHIRRTSQRITTAQEDLGFFAKGQLVWSNDGNYISCLLNQRLFIISVECNKVVGDIKMEEIPLAISWNTHDQLVILSTTNLWILMREDYQWIEVNKITTESGAHNWNIPPVLHEQLQRLEQKNKEGTDELFWEKVNASGWVCPVNESVNIIGQGSYIQVNKSVAPLKPFELDLPFKVGGYKWDSELNTLVLYDMEANKSVKVDVYLN